MTRLLRKVTGEGAGATAEAEPVPEGPAEDGPQGTVADPPTVTRGGEEATVIAGAGPAAAARRRRRAPAFWRKAALPAAVAGLLLAGSGFFHGAHQLRSTPSARNQALTDTGATTRVGGDVGEGLARVFSYAPAGADAAERSARTVLAGRAARQYTELFAQVRARLVEQRLTLTTQAVRTGVIELDGNRARLLVFLDQTSRRDNAAATSAAAQLTVTAEFRGDRWLIVDIKAR
ncbi:hypothetical protein AB0M38_11490 [Streptomyces sp. NPDC051742]|uniref:hypothetical protein n=1 Tax=unclassified Streptomyces TaxID=2593676 RepID=UPI003439269B